MHFSTKIRYAIRAMIQLAVEYGQGPVRLKDIADKQDISLKYLEQVMAPLRIGKYVKTIKGNKGGYLLMRKPEEISLYDLICCVEGVMSPVGCAENPESCARANICAVHPVWIDLKEKTNNELKKTLLSDLARDQLIINSK